MTQSGAKTALEQPGEETITRRAWLALSVSTLVVFLVVIDISAVNVAFPSIREDFAVSDAHLSWILGAYNIVVGSLLMLCGRLSDSIGRRKVYLPGVAIFGLGSALCAIAPSANWLIVARVIQAVGGSITLAAGFAVMLPEFPSSRRSTPIGIAGAIGALGAVVGPVVGSILIDIFSWRAIFWVNVPLCLLVLVLGPKLLSESRDPNATGRIDLVGVLVGTTSVATLMVAIVQSESWGLTDWRVIALVLVGLALIPVLIRRSRTHPEPLINLELFSYQSFRSANIGVVFYGLGFTAGAFASSLLLQDVWDLEIRQVGLALAPGPLLAAFVSPITGRWADRIGHRYLLAAGCMSNGLGFLLFILLLGEERAVWNRYVPLSLLVGLGVGLTVATWSSAGVSDISPSQFGVAGATYNTLRQAAYGLGISMVIALIGAFGETANITGIRAAFAWVAGSYFLAALTVLWTFPAGSAQDRAMSG